MFNTQGDVLTNAGEALYGQEWQTKLADTLNVTPRILRRWISGRYPIPRSHHVFQELIGLLRNHENNLHDVADKIEAWTHS
jgi:hypothetical protein